MEEIRGYLKDQRHRLLDELIELLRIPSISADPSYAGEVDRAADFVCGKLTELGASKVRKAVIDDGHPIVIAERLLDPRLPTVLIYGHYDVQPPDPVELWQSPPFSPEIREGKIYARGASDDKGQMYAHLKAAEFLARKKISCCNMKFVFEGEEESGSTALETFLRSNREELQADVAVVSDTAMLPQNTPAITVGLRGICTFEIQVRGANRDLHSGIYGGGVVNPAVVLSKMIAALLNDDNRIAIAGVYDSVLEYSSEERREMGQVMHGGSEVFGDAIGIRHTHCEKGFTPLECTTIRPSFDVNGLQSGYAGEGFKTVLPAAARAKISLRLVPEQKAEKISERVKKHLLSLAPKSVSVEVRVGQGADPVHVPLNFPAYATACRAIEQTFGQQPAAIRGGGSIPVVALLQSELHMTPLLMGFGQDSDAIHSPNEHFGVENYFRAIETTARFYAMMGERVLGRRLRKG
jgi:acetylornithine deacetylase/succinyl-diaminopimelate desuccinylase-like protein